MKYSNRLAMNPELKHLVQRHATARAELEQALGAAYPVGACVSFMRSMRPLPSALSVSGVTRYALKRMGATA